MYEGVVVTSDTIYERNGLGHDHINVSVDENFLEAIGYSGVDQDVEVEVQFELNRDAFCSMHYAIDQMPGKMDILFPCPPKRKEMRQRAMT